MPNFLAVSNSVSPVLGAVATAAAGATATGESSGTFDASLNSFLARPIDRASSGIFLGPYIRKTMTTTAITIHCRGSVSAIIQRPTLVVFNVGGVATTL